MGGAATEAIDALARRVVARHGAEVLAVHDRGAGSRRIVRVVVDRRGGLPVDTCTAISRELSSRLDERDPIAGRYTLEVTSPGTDWPLTTRADFERVAGRDVDVEHARGDREVERVRGRVVAVDDDAVELDADGRRVRVALDDVRSARQALPW